MFNEVEKQIQIIISNKNETLDYYTILMKELKNIINKQFDELMNHMDKLYTISQDFMQNRISPTEKEELVNDNLVDLIQSNRNMKEIVLAVQEKGIEFNQKVKDLK